MIFWILKEGFDKTIKNISAVCEDFPRIAEKCMKIALIAEAMT